MLGHVVYAYLSQQNEFEVYDIVYRNKLRNESIICDITNVDQFKKHVNQIRPDFIINCIGILIKESTKNPANAIFINSYFPNLLVQIADELNAKVIHVSTDCVFSGNKGRYSESDFRDADDIYGRSKALGEIFLGGHLTLRTSIIGPEISQEGEGLFHWFMTQRGEISGFVESYWGGVTTLQLAKCIEESIRYNYSGLLHITNGERISKFDLINLIKSIWEKHSIIIVPYSGKLVDKSLISLYQTAFKVPSYYDMLLEQRKWMIEREELYYFYLD